MAYTLTALPTGQNVLDFLGLANVTPGTAWTATADAMDGVINAAYQKVRRDTGYQWLPGSTAEVRYYDGSGSGELEVDEYVSVSAVQFLIYPQATGIDVTNFQEVQRMGDMAKTRLQIFRGPSYAVAGYLDRFPEGRSNVAVTAQYGYGTAMPYDVFMAVLKQSASDVAGMSAMQAAGRPVSWREGDVNEQYADLVPGDAIGWLKDVQDTVVRRTKPINQRSRVAAPPLY